MRDIDCLKPYRSIKGELKIRAKETILKGTCISLPPSLHQRAINIVHKNHQGLSKTKALLKEKVWFAGIDEGIETTLQSCVACQAVDKPAQSELLHLQDMPKGPWKNYRLL